MSEGNSTEDNQSERESIESTNTDIKINKETLMSNDQFTSKINSSNLENSYDKIKRPGLTSSMTAYHWIIS
ncbi:unnamed protein product [Heterobilharzia americana]|nr:unnamed protein product [Heterobilharzia americana]CAH8537520.1 unnamed protein product [Heterobilharzia americana]